MLGPCRGCMNATTEFEETMLTDSARSLIRKTSLVGILASLAQLVEHVICNLEVVGSSPAGSSNWGCSSIGRAPRLHRGFLLRVRVASAPRNDLNNLRSFFMYKNISSNVCESTSYVYI